MSQFRLHSCKKQLDEKTKLYDELLLKYNHLEEASGEQKLEIEQLQLAISKEGTSVKDSEREQYLIEQLEKTRENTRKQLNKSLETIKKLKADIEHIKMESAAETSVVMSKAVSRIKFLNAKIYIGSQTSIFQVFYTLDGSKLCICRIKFCFKCFGNLINPFSAI